MVLPSDHRSAEHPLDRVIVKRNPGILDKAREPLPALEHVAYGFAEVTAGQADLYSRPLPHLIQHRSRPLLSQLPAAGLRVGIAGKWARHQPLNRVQLAYERVNLGAGDGPVLGDLVVLPFGMGPTMDERKGRSLAGQDS